MDGSDGGYDNDDEDKVVHAEEQQDSPTAVEVHYPAGRASQGDVVNNPKLFWETLRELHFLLGTVLRVPIVSGQELDMHLLYKQVSAFGGLQMVISYKQWPEVCRPFNFPPTFTSKSWTLRKLYSQQLWHYEQVYLHRNVGPLCPAPFVAQPRPAPGVGGRGAVRGRGRVTGPDDVVSAGKRRRTAGAAAATNHPPASGCPSVVQPIVSNLLAAQIRAMIAAGVRQPEAASLGRGALDPSPRHPPVLVNGAQASGPPPSAAANAADPAAAPAAASSPPEPAKVATAGGGLLQRGLRRVLAVRVRPTGEDVTAGTTMAVPLAILDTVPQQLQGQDAAALLATAIQPAAAQLLFPQPPPSSSQADGAAAAQQPLAMLPYQLTGSGSGSEAHVLSYQLVAPATGALHQQPLQLQPEAPGDRQQQQHPLPPQQPLQQHPSIPQHYQPQQQQHPQHRPASTQQHLLNPHLNVSAAALGPERPSGACEDSGGFTQPRDAAARLPAARVSEGRVERGDGIGDLPAVDGAAAQGPGLQRPPCSAQASPQARATHLAAQVLWPQHNQQQQGIASHPVAGEQQVQQQLQQQRYEAADPGQHSNLFECSQQQQHYQRDQPQHPYLQGRPYPSSSLVRHHSLNQDLRIQYPDPHQSAPLPSPPPPHQPALVAISTSPVSPPRDAPRPTPGTPFLGSIDSAFDCGYFVTITLQGQQYRGVLYRPSQCTPRADTQPGPQSYPGPQSHPHILPAQNQLNSTTGPGALAGAARHGAPLDAAQPPQVFIGSQTLLPPPPSPPARPPLGTFFGGTQGRVDAPDPVGVRAPVAPKLLSREDPFSAAMPAIHLGHASEHDGKHQTRPLTAQQTQALHRHVGNVERHLIDQQDSRNPVSGVDQRAAPVPQHALNSVARSALPGAQSEAPVSAAPVVRGAEPTRGPPRAAQQPAAWSAPSLLGVDAGAYAGVSVSAWEAPWPAPAALDVQVGGLADSGSGGGGPAAAQQQPAVAMAEDGVAALARSELNVLGRSVLRRQQQGVGAAAAPPPQQQQQPLPGLVPPPSPPLSRSTLRGQDGNTRSGSRLGPAAACLALDGTSSPPRAQAPARAQAVAGSLRPRPQPRHTQRGHSGLQGATLAARGDQPEAGMYEDAGRGPTPRLECMQHHQQQPDGEAGGHDGDAEQDVDVGCGAVVTVVTAMAEPGPEDCGGTSELPREQFDETDGLCVLAGAAEAAGGLLLSGHGRRSGSGADSDLAAQSQQASGSAASTLEARSGAGGGQTAPAPGRRQRHLGLRTQLQPGAGPQRVLPRPPPEGPGPAPGPAPAAVLSLQAQASVAGPTSAGRAALPGQWTRQVQAGAARQLQLVPGLPADGQGAGPCPQQYVRPASGPPTPVASHPPGSSLYQQTERKPHATTGAGRPQDAPAAAAPATEPRNGDRAQPLACSPEPVVRGPPAQLQQQPADQSLRERVGRSQLSSQAAREQLRQPASFGPGPERHPSGPNSCSQPLQLAHLPPQQPYSSLPHDQQPDDAFGAHDDHDDHHASDNARRLLALSPSGQDAGTDIAIGDQSSTKRTSQQQQQLRPRQECSPTGHANRRGSFAHGSSPVAGILPSEAQVAPQDADVPVASHGSGLYGQPADAVDEHVPAAAAQQQTHRAAELQPSRGGAPAGDSAAGLDAGRVPTGKATKAYHQQQPPQKRQRQEQRPGPYTQHGQQGPRQPPPPTHTEEVHRQNNHHHRSNGRQQRKAVAIEVPAAGARRVRATGHDDGDRSGGGGDDDMMAPCAPYPRCGQHKEARCNYNPAPMQSSFQRQLQQQVAMELVGQTGHDAARAPLASLAAVAQAALAADGGGDASPVASLHAEMGRPDPCPGPAVAPLRPRKPQHPGRLAHEDEKDDGEEDGASGGEYDADQVSGSAMYVQDSAVTEAPQPGAVYCYVQQNGRMVRQALQLDPVMLRHLKQLAQAQGGPVALEVPLTLEEEEGA